MMAPSLVLQDGRPRLVVGSAGSAGLRAPSFRSSSMRSATDCPSTRRSALRVHLDDGHVHCEEVTIPPSSTSSTVAADVVLAPPEPVLRRRGGGRDAAGRDSGRRPPRRPWNRRRWLNGSSFAGRGRETPVRWSSSPRPSPPSRRLADLGRHLAHARRGGGSCARCAATKTLVFVAEVPTDGIVGGSRPRPASGEQARRRPRPHGVRPPSPARDRNGSAPRG